VGSVALTTICCHLDLGARASADCQNQLGDQARSQFRLRCTSHGAYSADEFESTAFYVNSKRTNGREPVGHEAKESGFWRRGTNVPHGPAEARSVETAKRILTYVRVLVVSAAACGGPGEDAHNLADQLRLDRQASLAEVALLDGGARAFDPLVFVVGHMPRMRHQDGFLAPGSPRCWPPSFRPGDRLMFPGQGRQ